MSAPSRTIAQRVTGVMLDVVAFLCLIAVIAGLGVSGWWGRVWMALVLMVAIRAIVIGHNVYEGLE